MTDTIQDILKRAVAAVEDAEVPDDLRAVAFEHVLARMFGSERIPMPAGVPEAAMELPADATSRLASKLGVLVESVQEIFHRRDDGTFSIHVPSSRLSKAKATATKQLAILAMAARQIQAEDWTEGDDIIAILNQYGKLDTDNNAKTMKKGDELWQMDGKGKGRKYRLRTPGWEAAGALVRTLTRSEGGSN